VTTIEAGGLTFYGAAHPSGLHFRRLIDWDGLPESKNQPRSRPNGHGAFGMGKDWREGIAVSWEGRYQAATRAAAVEMRRRLAGELGDNDIRVTVTDELGPTFRDVSVRRVNLGDMLGLGFEFSVDTFAVDPRRYGPEQTFTTGLPTAGTGYPWPAVWPADWGTGGDPGRLTMTNAGTTDTDPILEVRGGLAGGVELVETTTGSYLRLERDIPDGSTVIFDTRTQRVYLDDPANDVSTFLTRRDWAGFAIPKASSRTIQFNGLGEQSGSPLLTARLSPAYF
jgi:hypothetical protein